MARDGSLVALDGISDGPEGEVRSLRVFSLPEVKDMWHTVVKRGAGILPLDPFARFLGFRGKYADRGGHSVIDLQTLQTEEMPEAGYSISAFGPGVKYFAAAIADGRAYPEIPALFRGGQVTPLVVFAGDSPSPDIPFNFNRAGTHLAWTQNDGVVVVCEIAEAQRRLKEIGLEW